MRQRQIAREGTRKMKAIEKIVKLYQRAAAAAKEKENADNPDSTS